MTNYGPDKMLDLNTNSKNVNIGSTIEKLWLLKDVQLQRDNVPPPHLQSREVAITRSRLYCQTGVQ